jgi:hypothetical protein
MPLRFPRYLAFGLFLSLHAGPAQPQTIETPPVESFPSLNALVAHDALVWAPAGGTMEQTAGAMLAQVETDLGVIEVFAHGGTDKWCDGRRAVLTVTDTRLAGTIHEWTEPPLRTWDRGTDDMRLRQHPEVYRKRLEPTLREVLARECPSAQVVVIDHFWRLADFPILRAVFMPNAERPADQPDCAPKNPDPLCTAHLFRIYSTSWGAPPAETLGDVRRLQSAPADLPRDDLIAVLRQILERDAPDVRGCRIAGKRCKDLTDIVSDDRQSRYCGDDNGNVVHSLVWLSETKGAVMTSLTIQLSRLTAARFGHRLDTLAPDEMDRVLGLFRMVLSLVDRSASAIERYPNYMTEKDCNHNAVRMSLAMEGLDRLLGFLTTDSDEDAVILPAIDPLMAKSMGKTVDRVAAATVSGSGLVFWVDSDMSLGALMRFAGVIREYWRNGYDVGLVFGGPDDVARHAIAGRIDDAGERDVSRETLEGERPWSNTTALYRAFLGVPPN